MKECKNCTNVIDIASMITIFTLQQFFVFKSVCHFEAFFVKEMNATLNKLFSVPAGEDDSPPTCDSIFSTESSFDLLVHQKIIKYYFYEI